MADAALLKTKSQLDNRDFNKGVQQMKQQMKDLNKVSSDAFAAIGDALGVDVYKIRQFSSALQGLDKRLTDTGSAGSKAFGSIASSITPVAAGIAGLGLAAAIAAFKQLNAEATAFESTIQGGAVKVQTDAYVETYGQALRDASGAGEKASTARNTWREMWATVSGAFRSGFDFEAMTAANQAGERAKAIAKELYDIALKQKENSVKVSEIDAKIAIQREIISDRTKTAEERAEALATAQALITQKLNLQLPLEKRRRDLLVEYNGLASTTMKQYDAEVAAKISVNNLVQQEAAEQRQLLRQQKQINDELDKTKAAAKAIADSRASLAANRPSPIGNAPTGGLSYEMPVTLAPVTKTQIDEFKVLFSKDFGEINIGIGIDPASVEKLHDISNEVTAMAQDMAVTIGEAFGNLFADLATGENAFGNFANAAISAFGDMAVSVGKIAIEMGLASEGIKAALKLGNPYVAIAAGVALVALGTAVKSGLANIANGNYSASSSMATTTSPSTLDSDFNTKEMTVNVTGTLKADGNQLVAVIQNTQNRNSYTG
jgi:hypothetical protein